MKLSPILYLNIPKNTRKNVSFCDISIKEFQTDTFEKEKNDIVEIYSKLGKTIRQREKELKQRGVKSQTAIINIASLNEREYQKILFLSDKGLLGNHLENFIKINDKQYIRLLKLLRVGIEPYTATLILKLDDTEFNLALQYLNAGASLQDIKFILLCKNKEGLKKEITSLIQKGIPLDYAKKCTSQKDTKNNFSTFRQKGYNELTSCIFANSDDILKASETTRQNYAYIINTIRNNSRKTYEFCPNFIEFIKTSFEHFENIEEFEEYVRKIDFNKLFATAPIMKKYTDIQLLNFLETHYIRNCFEFKKEDLIIDNISEFLGENYIDSKTLNKLLDSYPLTKRTIGELPADWLDKTKDKKLAQEEIEHAISAFQHHKDTKIFENNLSQILNKKVSIKKLDSGSYGTAYKIEIEGALTTIIKTYHPRDYTFNKERHGRNIEPQVAMFVNQNSGEFVKMFFGRTCSKAQRDGFIITQYLDENTQPLETSKPNPIFKITCNDCHKDNVINGKIVDFGAIQVLN